MDKARKNMENTRKPGVKTAMPGIIKDLFLSYLSNTGYSLMNRPCMNRLNGLGFRLDPCVGTGHYWIYPVNDLFALSACITRFSHPVCVKISHGSFASLGSYEASNDSEFFAKVSAPGDRLIGTAMDEGEYILNAKPGDFIRSLGITLTPEFCRTRLKDRYGITYSRLVRILAKLNGRTCVPEFSMLLHQILFSSPSPGVVDMYYEAKIMEMISLLVQWDETPETQGNRGGIARRDQENLEKVARHIRDHYSTRIPLSTLCDMACMCRSKLSARFKQAYGMTISAYILSCRIEQAKQMLRDPDREIGRVAEAVGYSRQGSFSEMFKQVTGMTPLKFRHKNGKK